MQSVSGFSLTLREADGNIVTIQVAPNAAVRVNGAPGSLSQLVGYLESWSATQKFIAQNGSNPVDVIAAELKTAWGDPDVTRPAKWPLWIRVGRNMPGNS